MVVKKIKNRGRKNKQIRKLIFPTFSCENFRRKKENKKSKEIKGRNNYFYF
jgi:hypothetical protein